MQIRTLTLDDYPAARQLWDSVEHLGPVPRWEVERKLHRDPELFLVAEDDGEVVGTVMGSFDGRRGWIARLAVTPERQGEGIGRQLVAELEARMRDLGVHRVNLLAMSANDDGNAFWEALGFAAAEPIVLRSKVLLPEPEGDPAGSC